MGGGGGVEGECWLSYHKCDGADLEGSLAVLICMKILKKVKLIEKFFKKFKYCEWGFKIMITHRTAQSWS